MSSTQDPDTEPITTGRLGERQRAAIVLAVIAVAAVVLVVIMLSVLGKSSNSSGSLPNPNPTGPAVTVTGGAPPSTASSKSPSSPSTSSATSAAPPSNRDVSCPSSSPCALPDDIGNLIGALNSYRASHGQPAVTGTVTQVAKTCAVTSGDQCPSGFFWEPVGRSGEQVLSKITDSGKGTSALLDPGLKAIQVGWAYIPASHSFECALITGGG